MKHIAFIPARLGSKGLKYKNRKLFNYTALFLNKIKWIDEVVVSSDDPYIKKLALKNNFLFHKRIKKLSGPKSSIKSVLEDFVAKSNFSKEFIIWLFYLTIPIRDLKDFNKAKKIIERKNNDSLISLIPAMTHPFSCWYLKNNKMCQFVTNNEYRRQDLPSAYSHHHYLCSFKIKVLPRLNNELIYHNTYPIIINKKSNKLLEIDILKDFILFKDLKK
tara:strand:+ start:161 stop:814 length:654 start_codon:yes stop_codon:yes gene_type:complete